MFTINKFCRASWTFIRSLGTVIGVEARDSHYIEVSYSSLTQSGIEHAKQYPETVCINDLVKLMGFSVNFETKTAEEKVIRDLLLLGSCTVINLKDLPKKDLVTLHGVVTCDLNNLHYDAERKSHRIKDAYNTFVFYGATEEITWADTLVKVVDTYHMRVANNRVNWFNWLRHATYHPRATGCVYKFPNGLSVKMDNGRDPISSDNIRIYCETLEDGEVSRFNTENEFLVWLTKYF